MDQRIADHVAPYYHEQAAVDAARLATLRHTVFGDPAPPAPPFDSDRITFTQLRMAAADDPTAFPAPSGSSCLCFPCPTTSTATRVSSTAPKTS